MNPSKFPKEKKRILGTENYNFRDFWGVFWRGAQVIKGKLCIVERRTSEMDYKYEDITQRQVVKKLNYGHKILLA